MVSLKKLSATAFAALLLCLAATDASLAEGFPEPAVGYSARSYTEADSATLRSKVYYSPGKERREMEGGTVVMIARRDRNVVWQIFPGQRTFIEHSLTGPGGEGALAMRDYRADFRVERQDMGSETIDGMSTMKSRITVTGPEGKRFTGFMWTAREGIVVKVEAASKEDGRQTDMKFRLEDLKIGPQDPSLFEIPPGYTRTEPPGDMLGMPPGPGGRGPAEPPGGAGAPYGR